MITLKNIRSIDGIEPDCKSHKTPKGARHKMTHKLFEPTVIGIYVIVGFLLNYFQKLFTDSQNYDGLVAIYSVHLCFISALIILFIISLTKPKYSLQYWGFRFNTGFLVSIGLALVVYFLYDHPLRLFIPANLPRDTIQFVSLICEELFFRAMLINYLKSLFANNRMKWIIVIPLSAIIFTIPHIPSYSFSKLLGGTFQLGLVWGAIYYFSNSILFPMYSHVMLNRVDQFGMLGVIAVTVIYIVLSLFGYIENRRQIQ